MKHDPPWSQKVRLAEVGRGLRAYTLVADLAARQHIAASLNLDRLDALEAEASLEPWLDGAVLEARWSAAIEQTCGVTLEPFGSHLEGSFQVRILPPQSPNAPEDLSGEVAIDPLAEDPPDTLDDGEIDIAAYVVEHLALEIDPFPRKPGVEFVQPEEPRIPSPFDALRTFTPKPRGD